MLEPLFFSIFAFMKSFVSEQLFSIQQSPALQFLFLFSIGKKHRSSRPEVSCKKGVLTNVAKFTGKQLCQSLFFNKVAGRPNADTGISQ